LCAWVNVSAQEAVLPTLPQKTVDLTLPTQGATACPTLTTGSNCIRKVPSGDTQSLQKAISAATCGDTLVLEAGSTYSGNFTVPATTCKSDSGWIEIVSSELSDLPASGNRVAPADESKMAIISTPNVAPALTFLPDSNHWRIIGIKITTSYVSKNTLYWLVGMGLQPSGGWITSVSDLPDNIIFDRTYIYGSASTAIQRGIYANAQAFALVDSYCDEIVDSGADAQCINAVNGTGPFLIQNNFLQASGENIMFGGADPAITDLVPSDITIVGNLFQKNTSWRGKISDIKNFLELKNGQRLLIDGNVFQYDWAGGQQWSLLFRPVSSGKAPWTVVQDVTFTHNIVQHVPDGLETAASDGSFPPAQPCARILVRNNLFTDVSSASWGGSQGASFYAASNLTYVTHDIIFDHNTAFSDGKGLMLGDAGHVINFQFTNNLVEFGNYGIFGSGVAQGSAVISAYSNNAFYDKNVFVAKTSTGLAAYPLGTLWSSVSSVKFANILGAAPDYSGNFELLSTSPYHAAGTDGKDIGVWDWTCLDADTSAALTGKFVPGADGCSASASTIPIAPANLKAGVQ
jgi:hypothetical protein